MEELKFFREILVIVREGVVVAEEPTLNILFVNREACGIFGYSAEEFAELHLSDLHLMGMKEAAANAQGATCEACRKKDDSVFNAEINTGRAMIGGTACRVEL